MIGLALRTHGKREILTIQFAYGLSSQQVAPFVLLSLEARPGKPCDCFERSPRVNLCFRMPSLDYLMRWTSSAQEPSEKADDALKEFEQKPKKSL